MRRREYDDTAERFLESLRNVPDQPDPAEPLDEALESIDKADTRLHCSVMTMLTLAIVMLFFGSCLLALTNKQDFTDDERFSLKALASGKYLSRVESKFNDSVPLRDYLHNIDELLHWCYGLGNKLDLIDIQSKLRSEDPYSVETYDNFIPVDDSNRSNEGVIPDETEVSYDNEEEPGTTMKDDGNNKKLKGVTLSVSQTTKKDDKSPDGNTTTTKNGPPGATTTTTIPPETSKKRSSTEPTDTEPPETDPTDTEPSDTEPPETDPSDTDTSEPETEPPEDSEEE